MDCSVIGARFLGSDYTCDVAEGEGACVGSGTECYDDSETHEGGDSCKGAVLHFCNTGYRQSIDCRTVGFDGCDSSPDRGVAWCVKKTAKK